MRKNLIKEVSKFYNKSGWIIKNNISTDANLFEDLRKNSKHYIRLCRLRINKHIPKKGTNILDFASGPIQYKEYLSYSKNFAFRHCVDFSKDAIELAKKKLKSKGKYYHKNFFRIKFEKNFFDCSISLHTIYHIHKYDQKKAIIKLLNITKINSPVIVVYSNPNTLINKFKSIINYKNKKEQKIYFFCHPIKWWQQFENIADIKLYPWRSFSSQHQKIIFPNNIIGKFLFKIVFYCEEKFSNFFINNFQYYFIVLKKKKLS